MSKYRITLEGKTYEMEVELVPDDVSPQTVEKRTYREYKNSSDSNINVIDPSAQRQVVKNNGTVIAPMPGTVIKVDKKEGDYVKADEIVLILEAMKMENEIYASVDGTITRINCVTGGTVSGGDVLFEVKRGSSNE